MENFEKSKEAFLNEMKEKVEKEKEEQQAEFNTMMDARMREQAYLMEQGHREKAALLWQEIEELRRANTIEREKDIQRQKEMDDYRNLTLAQQRQIDDLNGALLIKKSKQGGECQIL
ncbi:hypothetical protein DPEC_G00137000 [Dallia pectoralis]|uniref:Uncharacterized protein n=1 Tax=Dallia pectoralis TaxID=75939 RepID=A0ACC2GM38_DALPE|nr:hypothetical protein DPEC_G00137000 [Dallia pectoralis]